MSNDTELMAKFAENLWSKFILPKINAHFKNNVSFYKAVVTANTGDGTLTVQKPYDTAINIPCNEALKDVAVGTQVLVLCFGKGNAKNQVAFTTGSFKKLYETTVSTDEKVKQDADSTSHWRPVLLGYNSGSTPSTIPQTEVTEQAYLSGGVAVNPSTGELSVGDVSASSMSLDNPLAIGNGGTGASNAKGARTNLEAMHSKIFLASNTANSKVRRSGNMVTFFLNTDAQSWSSSDITLGWGVPTGFRPQEETPFIVFFVANDGRPQQTIARGRVDADGAVHIFPNSSISASVGARANASWITTDAEPSAMLMMASPNVKPAVDFPNKTNDEESDGGLVNE